MYTHTTHRTRTRSAAVFTLTRGGHGPPPGVRPLETAAFPALRTPLPPALLSSWFLRLSGALNVFKLLRLEYVSVRGK